MIDFLVSVEHPPFDHRDDDAMFEQSFAVDRDVPVTSPVHRPRTIARLRGLAPTAIDPPMQRAGEEVDDEQFVETVDHSGTTSTTV